jgi:hypothetical protein
MRITVMRATIGTDNISIFIGGEMSAQIAKQLKRAEKAYERWYRSLGLDPQSAIKLKGLKLHTWKIPSGEELLRREIEKRAYTKLQKGRPTQRFLVRLERALYSNDLYEQRAALCLLKEITIPFRQGRGRPITIPDRKGIRAEARDLKNNGLKRTEIVAILADRHGCSASYVRRILEDTGTRGGEHRTLPSSHASLLRPFSDSA